jgi:hypothetical protein
MTTKNDSVVAIYPSHTAAEAAVKELQQSGFDMKKLSLVGRDHSILRYETALQSDKFLLI